jgi:predicted alpha/beta superfamily hydrolase
MKPTATRAKPAFISTSPETGTRYPIYIDAPARAKGPLPAVLLMDGDYFFDPAVAAARALRKAGRIPPTVVVGVGYGAAFGQPGNFRGRDYTPTASTDEPQSGGADLFLRYLAGTLWPELSRRHPLSEATRAIAGHSLGSLLVLHALFQPRPFFNLALASAPSIWWDNRSLLGLVSRLRDRQEELPGRLYLGVGAEDSPSMSADMGLLERQLADRPFKGLRVDSERFPGRDHYDVLPDTLRSGLARLLG